MTADRDALRPFVPARDHSRWIDSAVRLAVYDMLGREVAVLVDEVRQPGAYVVHFDGSALASGVYFARITADAPDVRADHRHVLIRKMILLK